MWSSESCILLKYSKQLERRPEALERARNLCQLLCEGFAALLLYLKHSPIFSYFSNLLPPLTSSLSAANLLHNVRGYAMFFVLQQSERSAAAKQKMSPKGVATEQVA